jgi:hypothetical protein
MQTILTWSYEPKDFFEAPTTIALAAGDAVFDEGEVNYTLHAVTDTVPADLIDSTSDEVNTAFAVRRLLANRRFKLDGPNIVQIDAAGRRHRTLLAQAAVVAIAKVGVVDVVVTDAQGRTASLKAERIKQHTDFVAKLAPKVLKSPELRLMVQSCNAAQDDPANELLYLYEVRDAAKKHFGNETAARKALGITKQQWQLLGRLANDEPLHEGRHRGSYVGSLRHATEAELNAARAVARSIIDAFAATV